MILTDVTDEISTVRTFSGLLEDTITKLTDGCVEHSRVIYQYHTTVLVWSQNLLKSKPSKPIRKPFII